MRYNSIWVTWEVHQRNRSICKELGVPLFEYESKFPSIIRYVFSICWLIKVLIIARPLNVFVQNPSIILAFIVVLLQPVFKYVVIMDAHNAGIFPAEGRNRFLTKISNFIQRMATITIITNNLLEKKVIANGGRPFIVPDPLPQPPDVPVMEVKGEFVVLVVCSFRDDEPVSEILQAAVTLPTRYRFYFTGNFKRADIVPSAYPEITFLGYVNEEEYWGYMKACNVVMDLTKRDDCLVCGAYESIASLKPVILKDSKVNKDLFRAGCVYTSLSPEAIARSVIHCDTDYNHLLHDVKQFNSEYKQEWVRCKQELFAAIEREKLN